MEEVTEKYFKYEQIPIEIKEEMKEKVSRSPFRQSFHVEAPSGYLNDPNGFSFYNGKIHLFYQWTPFKYSEANIWYQGWHHLVSEDLICWESLGPGVEPDTDYETHGSYSGSGLSVDGELLLFYTGNTRNELSQRIPYQIIATLDTEGKITKRDFPEITGVPDGYTDHFRDPKIWQTDTGDFYALIGIQRQNKTGAALMVHSSNTYNWEILSEVKTNLIEFGYMWECPDYFELEGQGIFIFSPQGLTPEGPNYQNIYQTGYLIGDKLSKDNLYLNEKSSFKELDQGFDFYAPQSTQLPDGRRIVIGWMGLPESVYPTENFGYCGCLTMPRELTLVDGDLIQKPIEEIKNYRKNQKEFSQADLSSGIETEAAFELMIQTNNSSNSDFVLDLCCNKEYTEYTRIEYISDKKELWLDRKFSGTPFATEFGTRRLLAEDLGEEIHLDIFIDTSSIEIFIDHGKTVASSRIFPTTDSRHVFFVGKEETLCKIDYWNIDVKENRYAVN